MQESSEKQFYVDGGPLKEHCFLNGSKTSPAPPSGSISIKMKKCEEDVKMVTAVAWNKSREVLVSGQCTSA